MDNLMDKERYAKLKAVEMLLTDFAWTFTNMSLEPKENTTWWAEKMLADLEQVEIDFEDRHFQAREASRD